MLRICRMYACLMVLVATLNGMNTAEYKGIIVQDLNQTLRVLIKNNPPSLDNFLLMNTYLLNLPPNIKTLNTLVLSYFYNQQLLDFYLERLTDAQIRTYGAIQDSSLQKSLTPEQIQEIINKRNQIIVGAS